MPTRVVQFSLLLLFLFWMTALALSESRGAAIEFQTVEEKKAVEAFEKGRIAAAQKQWDLAIRYFQEADAGFPVLYLALFLNLGLAHANAGHEVLAMAWLHAYLYAKPQAPNVEALRKELRRLEVVTESKISNIMQRVVASARTIQDEIKRESTLGTLAGYQAETGAIEQAERNLPKWDPGLDILWQRYGESLADKGDIEGALREASKVPTSTVRGTKARDFIFLKVMEFQINIGDSEGARQTLVLGVRP